MSFPKSIWARLRKARGQSMTEYTLLIAAVALVALFTGYQQLANIIIGPVHRVTALFPP